MTPATTQPAASANHPIVTRLIDTPVGPLAIGAHTQGVVLCEFSESERLDAQMVRLQRYFPCPIQRGDNPLLQQLEMQLKEYFAGSRRAFELALLCPGSEFQQKVWAQLLRIPYGDTVSYQELALCLGDAHAMRAVGTANGMNRIAVIIPCHRVINKNGQLGGYGGGLARKQFLLDLEKRVCERC